MIVRRLPDSELYHHGIKGQEWGDRNGPPYPLDSQTSAAVKKSAKKKNFIDRARDRHKMKKVRKARVEKMRAQQREKEERVKKLQQANAERRERAEIIKTGSAKDIQKFQHKMSAKEYEEALARVNFKQSLDSLAAQQAAAKSAKFQSRLNNVMNAANTVSSIAQSASSVYNSLSNMGIIKKKETKEVKSKLASLQEQRDILSVSMDIADLKYEKANLSEQRKEIKKLKKEEAKSQAEANIVRNDRVKSGEDKTSVSQATIEALQKRIEELEKQNR